MGDVAQEQGAAVAPAETGEQIVQRVCEEMAAKMPGPEHGLEIGETCDLVSRITIAAIRDAMDAEREACAQTADEMRRGGNPEGAADAIRARGAK